VDSAARVCGAVAAGTTAAGFATSEKLPRLHANSAQTLSARMQRLSEGSCVIYLVSLTMMTLKSTCPAQLKSCAASLGRT
jgi:hypothetical protein